MYMYKQDLALDSPKGLICQKIHQPVLSINLSIYFQILSTLFHIS